MKKTLTLLFATLVFGLAKPNLVVLDPASIEIIYMLGEEKQILAIAKMQNSGIWPEERTSKLKSVGTFSNPSLEEIVSLKPDVVILSSYSLNLEENLKKFHVKTLYLKADSLKDVADNVLSIGKLLGEEAKAQKLVADYEGKLNEFKKNPLNKKGIFVYSASPLMVFPGNTLPGDVFETIGIENVAANLPGQRPILSKEYLLKNNPGIILYGLRVHNQDELIKSEPFLKNTDAFKRKEIFYVNAYSLLRGTPRIIESISKLYDQIRR